MSMFKKIVLASYAVIIIVDVIGILIYGTLAVGNVNFMIGLLLMIGAAFFIIKDGHLFTGWRFSTKKKTDLEQENLPKQPGVREVGSVKNQPIKFGPSARFCLLVGGLLIVLGVGLTLI